MQKTTTTESLYSIGQPALKFFNALRYEAPDDKSKMDKVLEAMERYYLGKTNVIFHRCTFNNRSQEDGETFDAYLTDLEDHDQPLRVQTNGQA